MTAGPTVVDGTEAGGFPGGAAGQIPDFPGGQIPGGAGGQFPDFPGGQGGGIPGMGNAARPSDQVLELLQQDADRYTWVAATIGSTAAAPYQLATHWAVMPLGGFSSGDPSPALEQFQQDVADKEVHWFIGGGGLGGGGFGGGAPGGGAPGGDAGQTPGIGTTEAQKITTWVRQNFASTTVDGVTLYDLTATPTPQ